MPTKNMSAVIACYEHALGVIKEMQRDIERGASPLLACGIALVSMQAFKLARVSKKHFENRGELLLNIEQALQCSISVYEDPKVIAAVGEERAEQCRLNALAILEQLTRGTEPPLFIQSNS